MACSVYKFTWMNEFLPFAAKTLEMHDEVLLCGNHVLEKECTLMYSGKCSTLKSVHSKTPSVELTPYIVYL